MDMESGNKKLGLKERYNLLTRGLGWETTYQPMDKVFRALKSRYSPKR